MNFLNNTDFKGEGKILKITKLLLLLLCIIIGGLLLLGILVMFILFKSNIYNSITLFGFNGLLGLFFISLVHRIRDIRIVKKDKPKIIVLSILFVVMQLFGFYYSMLTSYDPADYDRGYVPKNNNEKRLYSLLVNELQSKITPEDNPNNKKIVYEKYGAPNRVSIEEFSQTLYEFSSFSETTKKVKYYEYDNFTIVSYILNTGREVYDKQVFSKNSPLFLHNYLGMSRTDIRKILGEDNSFEDPDCLIYRINNIEIYFHFNKSNKVRSIIIPYPYRNPFASK